MIELTGWRVLVPRPAGRSDELARLLVSAGAVPVHVPLIRTAEPDDLGPLDAALDDLSAGRFRWLGLTSAAGVAAVLNRVRQLGRDHPVPETTRVAAVGSATAAALRLGGVGVDLVPTGAGSAAALVAEWPAPEDPDQDRVLLPVSGIASDTLADGLTGLGYLVHRVTAYRTVPQLPPPSIVRDLATGVFDAVLFTSPSTVTALDGLDIGAGTALIAIGEATAAALREDGHPVHAVAERPSAEGLVSALQRCPTDPGVGP